MKKYYVYIHHIEDVNKDYPGMSCQKYSSRFINAGYKSTVLWQYLNPEIPFRQNPNITTTIVAKDLTYEDAAILEDTLIKVLPNCINYRTSGLHKKNRDELYRDYARKKSKIWYYEHREEKLEYSKQYQKKKRKEKKKEKYNIVDVIRHQKNEKRRKYYQDNKEKMRKYQNEYNQRPDVKAKKYEHEHSEEYKAKRREYMREYMRKRRNNIKNQ